MRVTEFARSFLCACKIRDLLPYVLSSASSSEAGCACGHMFHSSGRGCGNVVRVVLHGTVCPAASARRAGISARTEVERGPRSSPQAQPQAPETLRLARRASALRAGRPVFFLKDWSFSRRNSWYKLTVHLNDDAPNLNSNRARQQPDAPGSCIRVIPVPLPSEEEDVESKDNQRAWLMYSVH